MYLQKLTELLCSEEDIRKDIMELRFWCKLREWNIIWLYTERRTHIDSDSVDYEIKRKGRGYMYLNNPEILWNDLHLHHLLWYCELTGVNIVIRGNWIIWDCDEWKDVCKIDITKPLHQQSEKTLEAIYNFLENNK